MIALMGLSPIALWSVLSTPEEPEPSSSKNTATQPAQVTVTEPVAEAEAPSETSEVPVTKAAGPDEPQLSSEDVKLARLIVGSWEQERFGTRQLTVNADGTASMIIKPASLYAFAFGSRIDLNMYWTIKDGHLDYGFKDGTPQAKVDLAAKSWGDHWVEKIERVSEAELVLINETDGLPSRWTKAATSTTSELGGVPEPKSAGN